MASELHSQTARANGARSRGPVTVAGKNVSAQNSTRHGVLSQTVVLDGESKDRFEELLAALTSEFTPRTPAEAALVETMAIARLRQMRVWGIQKAGFDLEMARLADSDSPPPVRAAIVFRNLSDSSRVLDLLHRYETAFDRQFSRALSLLIKLRDSNAGKESVPDAILGPLTCATVTWEPTANFPSEPSAPQVPPNQPLANSRAGLPARSRPPGRLRTQGEPDQGSVADDAVGQVGDLPRVDHQLLLDLANVFPGNPRHFVKI